MTVKEYVLGFLFNDDDTCVLMIQKQRPEWQRGLLNGIGGSIEERDETPLHAMNREAHEEAGLDPMPWKLFAVMEGKDWKVHCFTHRLDVHDIHEEWGGPAKQMEGETIEECWVEHIRDPKNRRQMISNIPWLIEMALDQNHGNPTVMHVRYGEGRWR